LVTSAPAQPVGLEASARAGLSPQCPAQVILERALGRAARAHEAVDPEPLVALEATNHRVQRPVDDAVRAVLGLFVAAERPERSLDVVLVVGAAVADLAHEAAEDVAGATERLAEEFESHD
jgi:hypothetical protein